MKSFILITNDDGINSPSLFPLKQAIDNVGDTLVFAPDHNWSASGHPKTMHKPLRADTFTMPDGSSAYVSTAPPSDCVALALLGVIDRRPDLVVSGVNHGANLGYDIYYSGTIAAAVEATIQGVPAIAVSRERVDEDMAEAVSGGYYDQPVDRGESDHDLVSTFCAHLAKKVLTCGLPTNTLLNVNIPAIPWSEIKGVTLTRLGRRVYRDELVVRADPRGRPYYWIGGLPPKGIAEHGTDIWAMENHLISITPLNLNLTDRHLLTDLNRWNLTEIPL